MWCGFGVVGFFFKADNAGFIVDCHDAQFGGVFDGYFNAGYCEIGIRVVVKGEHFAVIHFVHVVAAQNEDAVGTLAFEDVDILKNGIGCAAIPVAGKAKLGRDFKDKFVEFGIENGPAALQMPVERC